MFFDKKQIKEAFEWVVAGAIVIGLIVLFVAVLSPVIAPIINAIFNAPCDAYANMKLKDIPARCYDYFGGSR
jgi:hypothetical protein